MTWNHASELKERIARFDDSIAGFKRNREQMLARRQSAADHIMVELDERLVINARALDALERSRELARDDLKRAEDGQKFAAMARFVVVDDTPGGRSFLSRILLGHFPAADIIECENSDAALIELRAGTTSAFLVHRASDADGLPLVELLRVANPTIPIVYVSGVDRTEAALAAGATTFLHFDQARLIGQVMRDILRSR